jgi:amino-acid N-acetyltransferase
MQMIKVGGSGLNHLRASLRQAGLPYDDVSYPGRQFYRFEVDEKWVAYGGLEGAGPDLLLRSLVVCEEHRGAGLGKAVLSELEQLAASQGAARLHLLTQKAVNFLQPVGTNCFIGKRRLSQLPRQLSSSICALPQQATCGKL